MIMLQANKITKYYGVQEVFSEISFIVEDGEKVGLVGPNGAGKTTLLKCLTGEELLDGGTVSQAEGAKLGYLEQIPYWQEERSIMEELLDVFTDLIALRKRITSLEKEMGNPDNSPDELEKIMVRYSRLVEEYEQAGGYEYESKAKKITKGLGFLEDDFKKDIRFFSGGQKTRLNLAKVLVREPEILILDEPTNHLDIEAIEWLEGYLRDYKGTLLVISHDRFFLDKIVHKIIELRDGNLEIYKGNYSRYLILKEEMIKAKTNAYLKQQQEIKKTQEYIEKYRAGIKAKQARGRQSILNRLERLEAPPEEKNIKKMDFQPLSRSGERVLEVLHLNHHFEQKELLVDVNFSLNRGEKVGLVGANGTGKSTLLKIIIGQIKPWEGELLLGSQVKIGYFSQEHENLNQDNLVIRELTSNFPLGEEQARNLLGRFLFSGDDVFKSVKSLSGGEKGRLALLKLLLEQPNFLILDEPTNHLDIASKERVEESLKDYSGTVLVVSHDRYFLDQTVNRILEIKDGGIASYLGNYSYFKAKKEEMALENQLKQSPKAKTPKNDLEKEKRKNQKLLATLEEEISALEDKISKLKENLTLPQVYSDGLKTKSILGEIEEIEKELREKYDSWEELLSS